MIINSTTNGPEGSIALRNFFNELFLERQLSMSSEGDNGDSDSDNVSLSSDEETAASCLNNDQLTSTSYHTRRHRFRRSCVGVQRRPMICVSSDNARGMRNSKTELMVSSYHNPKGISSNNCRHANYPTAYA